MRWLIPQQNEIFWKNILKHDLTESEWKILIAFVVDAPGFPVAQKVLSDRTRISHQPNISTILKSLFQIGILIKDAKDNYEINPSLIDLNNEYVPQEISTSEFWKELKTPKNPGAGNFKKQAETKREKLEEADRTYKKMRKETATKKRRKYPGWETYFSKSQNEEISVQVEKQENGFLVQWCRGNPNTNRVTIPPLDVIEEFCREILKIEDPNEIYRYMYSPYQDEFIRKYKLKRPE